jgi:conjugative relaxase-like TrwC/TraI family protein
MFSMKKLGAGVGAVDYYINAAGADDYYLRSMDPPGHWTAAGNSLPGVESGAIVEAETWRALLAGFDPTTGEMLVNGAGENHVSGFDLTFSDPKSISSIWAVAPPGLREKIEQAHEKAVLAAMQFAAENAAYTRRGKAGATAEKLPGLVYGKFSHGTSRELDPQVHDHCVVPNVQLRADGTYGTIEAKFIMQWQGAIAGVFHAEHSRLLNEIGLKTIVDPRSGLFEVDGVPEQVIEGWSKRTQQIKAAAGVEDTSDLSRGQHSKAVIETRVAKAEISRAELLENWEAEGKLLGWDAAQAAALVGQGRAVEQVDINLAVQNTVQRVFFGESVASEAQFMSTLTKEIAAAGGGAREIGLARIAAEPFLLQLTVEAGGESKYTTREILTEETQMVELAKEIDGSHRLNQQAVEDAIAAQVGISPEQARAVRWATLGDRRLSIVEGSAGAGKSFTMAAVMDAYRQSGYEIHGLALAWAAAQNLEQATKEKATAIAGFLSKIDSGEIRLNEKSLILIDEAGMVGSSQFQRILAAASEAGAKVIATGDSKQLAPVERGGALSTMVADDEIRSCRIDTIRRQEQEWQQEVVADFRDGRSARAIHSLLEHEPEGGLRLEARAADGKHPEGRTAVDLGHGRIAIAADRTQMISQMAADYLAVRASGRSALMLASTNSDVRDLNTAVQAALKERGDLKGEGLEMKCTDGRDAFTFKFYMGDQIQFRARSDELGVVNRDAGVIRSIEGGKMVIELEGKGLKTVDLEAYRLGGKPVKKVADALPITPSYAMTVHGAQGATVDVAIDGTQDRATRNLKYVSASRHTEDYMMHIDASAAAQGIQRSATTTGWKAEAEYSPGEVLDHMARRWSKSGDKETAYAVANRSAQARQAAGLNKPVARPLTKEEQERRVTEKDQVRFLAKISQAFDKGLKEEKRVIRSEERVIQRQTPPVDPRQQEEIRQQQGRSR